MSSGRAVAEIAKTQIGLTGATRYGGKPGDAWCALFVCWCAKEAGVKRTIVPKEAWCDNLRDFFIDQRRFFLRDGYTPKVGDIVCFQWTQDGSRHVQHVGLVCEVDDKNIYTVEGNAGIYGEVCARTHPRNRQSILGYLSPDYEVENGQEPGRNILYSTVSVLEERALIERISAAGAQKTPGKSGLLSITITAEGRTFAPKVLAGVSLSQTVGSPSVLTFEVLPDGNGFYEGNRVRASVGETTVFTGFIFTKARDRDGIIRVTAYDSLRYFKNKDTYVYENKTAGELLKILCRDHGLRAGEVAESQVRIPYRMEENVTLFDLMDHALRYTEEISGVRYILRDVEGSLCLTREWESGAVLDEENLMQFSYSSSLDGMYNRVKTIVEANGVRDITLVQDKTNIGRYGLLQTVLKQSEKDLKAARGLLKQKNRVQRRLCVETAGDIRLIAGATVAVRMNLGDTVLNDKLRIASVRHTWDGKHHVSSLTLEGGLFDA